MEGPHLAISIEPSRRLCVLLLVLHAAAIVAPWAADLAPAVRALLSLAAAGGLMATWRSHSAQCRAGPWTLRLHDEAWTLERAGGSEAIEPCADSTVWERLVVVRARRADGQVRTLVVLPDCCGAEDLRRLRAALRMGRGLSRAAAG